MSHLTFIFLVTSLLLYTLRKYLINIASTEIQLYRQSNSISTYLVHLQYFLIPVNLNFLAAFRSALLIAQIYFLAKLIKLDACVPQLINTLIYAIFFGSSFFFLPFFKIIISLIEII